MKAVLLAGLVLFSVFLLGNAGRRRVARCTNIGGVCQKDTDTCASGEKWPYLCGRAKKACCVKESLPGDILCITHGGICFDSSSTFKCNGPSGTGYCGGVAGRRCCIESFQPGDNVCFLNGGDCIDTKKEMCWGGKVWNGRCGGPASRKCCIHGSTYKDKGCVMNYGGHCAKVADGCPNGNFWAQKSCKNYPKRKCCSDDHPVAECIMNRGGQCIPTANIQSECTDGKWSNDYCGMVGFSCCIRGLMEKDTRCVRSGGKCLDSRTEKCYGGNMWASRCDGKSYRKCCIPKSRGGDKKCINSYGGHCVSVSEGCPFGDFLAKDGAGCKNHPDRKCCGDTTTMWVPASGSQCVKDAVACSDLCTGLGKCAMNIANTRDAFGKCRALLVDIDCVNKATAKCDQGLASIVRIKGIFDDKFRALCVKILCGAGAERCFGGQKVSTVGGKITASSLATLCTANQARSFEDCADDLVSLQSEFCDGPQSGTNSDFWQDVLDVIKTRCTADGNVIPDPDGGDPIDVPVVMPQCLTDMFACSELCTDKGSCAMNLNGIRAAAKQCTPLPDAIKCINGVTCNDGAKYVKLFERFRVMCNKMLCPSGQGGISSCFYPHKIRTNGVNLTDESRLELCKADVKSKFAECASSVTAAQELFGCPADPNSNSNKFWQSALEEVKTSCP